MSSGDSQKRIIVKNNIISYSSEVYQFCKNINEINNQNEKGEAPIYSCILSNDIKSLKKLLLLGSNPNIQNISGETPLYLCVTNNSYDAFLLLLKNNADCNIQNKNGDTPLHAAIQKKENKYIKYLLKSGSNPNCQNLLDGKTPTHLAMENKLDEDILKLFKENNADIFSIKDKYNKTAFDYAKDINDEEYINLVIKIFGYNVHTVANNKNNNTNMNTNINTIFMSNTEENKCNINFNEKEAGITNKNSYNNNNINTDYYVITTETNKGEFKIDNNDSSKEGQIQSQIRNKIILSSDVSSDNVQLKELNNSFDINSNKSKSVKEIFNNELKRNTNKNKENIEPNDNNKNINANNLYSQASESSNNSKNHFNKRASRNSDKSKNKKSSIAISHSNSSNNYNSLVNNQYLTNSVGVNRKIIKNIIHDTVKKISVKSISSSDDNNTSKSNVNILSKESEVISYSNSNKEDSKSKISKISFINSNVDNSKINENESFKIQNNNINLGNNIDDNSAINLYENGTNSFLLLKSKNLNEIINNDNISVSKLIKNTTKTININHIYDELYSSTNKTNEFNTIKSKEDNENSKMNVKEIVPIDNNNIIINTNGNSKLNINEIKGDIILESINSNLFDDLDIKTDNIGTINNDISLSYSKNLQTEEDNQNQLKMIQNKTIDMENNSKIIPENKSNSNSNFEIKIIDPDNTNYQKQYINAEISISNNKLNLNEKINISDNKIKDNNSVINNNKSDKDIITDSHIKKKSNGIVQNNDDYIKNKSIIDNHMKKDKSEIKRHSNSSIDNLMNINQDSNGANNSPLLKRKIIKKNINKIKNKNQIYLKHHRQLSYHLNCKSNLNNIYKEKDTLKKMDISNLNGTYNSNLNLDISNINKDNMEHKENDNPNNSSLKNESIYKNKNNLINAWHNNNTHNSIKSSLKSKNLNNISEINRVSKISLSKSGSIQNMNPPPIIYKEISLSSSNHNSIINQNNNNHIIHNRNKKNKFSNANTILNNTTLSTKKPMHSSYTKGNNNIPNNLKSIPIGNNTSNNNSRFVNIKQYNYSNIFNDDDDSDDSNNNSINNEIKQLKDISTPILIKLREWLLSCDLLCYYNILLSKNMYHIDSYINDIKNGIIPITYEKIEKIGIKKPGHIFRLLVKLDLDAGLIDKNLFNYIIDKINFNSVTNTLILNSSSNDACCCGINLCPKNNNNHIVNNQNKRNIRNKGIYFNDLSSFLRVNDIIRFKGNFLHNGFDKIEFIVIQLFSRYSFNRKILNEYLHIYIDKDKIKILNILYNIKANIAKEFGIKINEDEYEKILCSFHKEDKENDNNKLINNNNIENNDITSNQKCDNINNNENNTNQNCLIF